MGGGGHVLTDDKKKKRLSLDKLSNGSRMFSSNYHHVSKRSYCGNKKASHAQMNSNNQI